MVFRHRDLTDFSMEPFEFVAQARRRKTAPAEEAPTPREPPTEPRESPRMNTSDMLRLFVYGTLKRGYWTHTRFARACWRSGRREFAAVSTRAQASRSSRCRTRTSSPAGAWGAVYGELLTFDDPKSHLPGIDRLEGFRPGGPSLYRQRAGPPATVNGARELAWVYTVETTRIKRRRIVSGCWPE